MNHLIEGLTICLLTLIACGLAFLIFDGATALITVSTLPYLICFAATRLFDKRERATIKHTSGQQEV